MSRNVGVAVLVAVAMAWGGPLAAQTGEKEQPVRAEAWELTVLHDFAGAPGDGASPTYGSLTLSGSTLYGTTNNGGASDGGVLFKIGTDGSGYVVLHHFGGNDGYYPNGSLTLSGSTLYGMTAYGGTSNKGVVFSVQTNGTGYTVLHHFTGQASDGAVPIGSLALSGSYLYGMTREGGTLNAGVLFALGTGGGGFTLLHIFGLFSDGREPWGSLVTDGANLWGMTNVGGLYDVGVLFWMRTDGSDYTILHHFEGWPVDGANPYGTPIRWYTSLYGMTYCGGGENVGVVFSDSVGGGGFTLLHEFTFGPSEGFYPTADLTRHGSTLYGTTEAGGPDNEGTVFSIGTEGSDYAVLHSFAYALEGINPMGSLTYSAGALYGMTRRGGGGTLGVIFRLQPLGLIFADDFDSGDTSAWSFTQQ